MNKHIYSVGQTVELVKAEFLDHLKEGLKGKILLLTFDDGNPTYLIKFDGAKEPTEHVYADEVEVTLD